MADRELIAAVLTAGMLPTLEIPPSRVGGRPRPLVRGRPRPLTGAEAEDVQCAVDHAFGLYRLVLNGLGADPFVMEETCRQSKAPADVTRDTDQARETEVRWKRHVTIGFKD
jgi:hypothetical protein